MQQNSSSFSIKFLSRELSVSRSSYYAFLSRPMSKRKQEDYYLAEKIISIHKQSKQIYGSPRVTAELKAQGIKCSKKRVARLMKKHDIRSKTRKKFKPQTTNSNHNLPKAQNLVSMNFNPVKPNTLWCSDITYIRTLEGWLYLSIIQDLYSRMIISWAVRSSLDENLVVVPLGKALEQRRPAEGLIFHSDQGSQYASFRVRELLEKNKVRQSMSSKGNCYDNAAAESWFGKLKTEWICDHTYRTKEEAIRSLFEYIEVFYNRRRRHSTLGYLSPLEFENQNHS